MQIKSKDRVREKGEVFTAEREVKAMVDLVDDMARNVEGGTFLEPACGDGNFLIEILTRKCAALKACMKPKWQMAELYAYRLAYVLSLLYGIDIMPDNVKDCRKRLAKYVLDEFDKVVKGKDNGARKELETAAQVITEINIVEGDALHYTTNSGDPIVFVKWRSEYSPASGSMRFGLTPYRFKSMVGEDEKNQDLFKPEELPIVRSNQFDFYRLNEARDFMKEAYL